MRANMIRQQPQQSSVPQEQAGRREVNVRVMNGNTTTYRDAYNGVEYVFEASKTRSLPLAAAYHIFGYQIQGGENAPKTMFDHVCKRWGWNTPENVKDGFKTVNEIWRKFEFTPVAVRYTEVPVIDTAALAEPRENDAATA